MAALLVTVALGLSAACGDDDGEGEVTGTSTTTVPAEGVTSTTAGGAPATTVTTAGRVIEVVVSGGRAEGGFRREKVKAGEPLTLRVRSDTADEVHVHGYDRRADVAAGGAAEITFTPDVPGVFEVELEESQVKLLELEVQP